MIRVAFTLIGGSGWLGGQNYLLNLLRILTTEFGDRITPVVFVAEESAQQGSSAFDRIGGVEVVMTPLLNGNRRITSLLLSLLWGRDGALVKLFEKHQINLVFEVAQFFGWRIGLPAIAWIPDFQHLFLPDMFSAAGRFKRELGFRAQVASGRMIMLSSEDARQVCLQKYPVEEKNTRTVRFAVLSDLQMTRDEARRIAAQYELPEVFFYMPNQVWRHKNHNLVVEALAMLGQRGIQVFVAASGSQEDPRNPGYFADLQKKIADAGITRNIRFLGLIPYGHVSALMRASCGLINPSLFEGWSTTVEEARAAGVPMLLSDLDVHREQMGDQAVYFERDSADSLANALAEFEPPDEQRRQQMAEKAGIESKLRVKQFGESFTLLVESCVRQAGRK